MTKITYVHKDNFFAVRVEGHAGYNPGNDIVCSAISTLTCSLAETVQQEEAKGHIKTIGIELNDGIAEIACKCIPSEQDRLEMAFKTITNGYALIADKYTDNVDFIEF